jgi:hypothetical protein
MRMVRSASKNSPRVYGIFSGEDHRETQGHYLLQTKNPAPGGPFSFYQSHSMPHPSPGSRPANRDDGRVSAGACRAPSPAGFRPARTRKRRGCRRRRSLPLLSGSIPTSSGFSAPPSAPAVRHRHSPGRRRVDEPQHDLRTAMIASWSSLLHSQIKNGKRITACRCCNLSGLNDAYANPSKRTLER